jgi:hypothetical protein
MSLDYEHNYKLCTIHCNGSYKLFRQDEHLSFCEAINPLKTKRIWFI